MGQEGRSNKKHNQSVESFPGAADMQCGIRGKEITEVREGRWCRKT